MNRKQKKIHKRTWAKIDLDALKSNVNVINQHLAGKSKIMAVVKADAYGHGAPVIAKELAECNIDFFGVSNIDEAVQLRENGITQNILILGYTESADLCKLAVYNITQTVFDIDTIKNIYDVAKESGKKIRVHIKIDTGMNRIGFRYMYKPENSDSTNKNNETVLQIINAVQLYSEHIDFEGIFTHFAESDNKKSKFTHFQFTSFCNLVQRLEKENITFKLKHTCNSGGCVNFPEMHLDYVRCGIILYGLYPSKQTVLDGLVPIMQLKTAIAQIHDVLSGETVSYSRTYKSDKNIKAATIPVGYADGFSRLLSNSASVMIKGKKVPVIGRVCMDQSIIDVSDCENVKVGDTVTIFGEDCGESISVDYIADMMETINYEVVCLIGKRVPRIFYKDNIEADLLNYIIN